MLTQRPIRWGPPIEVTRLSVAERSAIARALLTGPRTIEDVRVRLASVLGRRWRWITPLARSFVGQFADRPVARHREALAFLRADETFERAERKYGRKIRIVHWPLEPHRMRVAEFAAEWGLPILDTLGDLADWLSVTATELDWFADLKALGNQAVNQKLLHYHYSVMPKRTGGVRIIEQPKARLKSLQRRILSAILQRVPAHPAAHGFVKGRSTVSYAAPHVGQAAVLRIDLENFFPAFPAVRAQAFYRTLGYPEKVADYLGGLCTNSVARHAWPAKPWDVDERSWRETIQLYARPHLPQGAPTSPALANLTAYRLDCRLSGLAKTAGCTYTRYADDLAFSGDGTFLRSARTFALHAAAIALEEGFGVNFHKTRVMTSGTRQQLAGVVVNERVNVSKDSRKQLEAVLTNCVRLGPATQNREQVPDFKAHLQGRVGYVQMINPAQAAPLRTLLDAIDWSR